MTPSCTQNASNINVVVSALTPLTDADRMYLCRPSERCYPIITIFSQGIVMTALSPWDSCAAYFGPAGAAVTSKALPGIISFPFPEFAEGVKTCTSVKFLG